MGEIDWREGRWKREGVGGEVRLEGGKGDVGKKVGK